MKVILTPDAVENLEEITDPLHSDVIHRLSILGQYPMIGATMGGPFTGYRSTVIDFFRIVYRIRNKDTIEVAYIRDCRRKPA